MDQAKYKRIFDSYVGNNIDTIATVDHVFGSPPLRIIDSHYQLSKIKNSTAILWDTTYPNLDKYRTELIMDAGLLSYKHKDIFLYDESKPYCLTSVKHPKFELQRSLVAKILSNIDLIEVSESNKKTYLDRLDELIDIYERNTKDKKNSSDFYINLLEDLYRHMGFQELAQYIQINMFSLYKSKIIDKYIPEIIKESKDDLYGYVYLLKNTDLFQPPYFRSLINTNDESLSNKDWVLENMDKVCNLLSEKKILPHHTLYFWAWGISGIKHFGNDYGNFEMIGDVLSKLGVSNNISTLQLTKPKMDGINFVVFDKTRTFTLINKQKPNTIKFNMTNTKSSRASNLCSVYLNSGDKIRSYWESYKKSGKVINLDMEKII